MDGCVNGCKYLNFYFKFLPSPRSCNKDLKQRHKYSAHVRAEFLYKRVSRQAGVTVDNPYREVLSCGARGLPMGRESGRRPEKDP